MAEPEPFKVIDEMPVAGTTPVGKLLNTSKLIVPL